MFFFFLIKAPFTQVLTSPLQTGPCDVSYIDPEFTRHPVPAFVNERREAASEAFLGFSYMKPAECVAAEPVS